MQYRIVTVEYFLEKMQPWEVDAIMENANFIDSPEWDRTRLEMYSNMSIWSKKKLKITDILSFPWDNDSGGGTDTTISDNDIERLRNKAKQYGNI